MYGPECVYAPHACRNPWRAEGTLDSRELELLTIQMIVSHGGSVENWSGSWVRTVSALHCWVISLACLSVCLSVYISVTMSIRVDLHKSNFNYVIKASSEMTLGLRRLCYCLNYMCMIQILTSTVIHWIIWNRLGSAMIVWIRMSLIDTWSSVDDAVWGGSAAFLKEVCHWGMGFGNL